MSTEPLVTIVDTEPAVQILVNNISNLPTSPPSLYFDLEGVNLGRDGTISLMQIYVPQKFQVYIIDIFILGETAFSTTGRNGQTLRSTLESASIPKVFFDIRNDSDALFSHYQISVDGIQDLQLMELATRTFSKRYVNGLAKCVERDSRMSATKKRDWQMTKESTGRLYDPKRGGSYQVFNYRPILPDILRYCAQDVLVLPELWLLYNGRLTSSWRRRVISATQDRITESQSPYYIGQGMHKAIGPWDCDVETVQQPPLRFLWDFDEVCEEEDNLGVEDWYFDEWYEVDYVEDYEMDDEDDEDF